jgi:hypothetical protein
MRLSDIKVLHQPLHALGFAEHDLEEAGAGVGILGGVAVLERLDEAEQRRQRGAQLVAGIGDEIDAGALGGAKLGAVDQPRQPGVLAERMDGEREATLMFAQAHDLDRAAVFAASPRQAIGGGRVADGQPYVHADHGGPEQRAGGTVGVGDTLPLDQQHGIGNGIEDRVDRHRGAILGLLREGWRRRVGLGRRRAQPGPGGRCTQQGGERDDGQRGGEQPGGGGGQQPGGEARQDAQCRPPARRSVPA